MPVAQTSEPFISTPTPKPPNLYALAREALAQVDNDAERATEALTSRLLSDALLLRMLIEAAIREAAYSAVGSAVRNSRQAVLRDISKPTTPALDGAAIQNVLRMNLLDFALAGGLKLRDATKEDVLAQVNRYATQADDMAHKARWLQRVAESLPARKRVGQALSAEELQRLFEEAK